MPTDLELLDAWRGGDTQAGASLFERYFEPVYRFFRHKVGGDVDDVVQRSFLAMTEARVRLREGSSFRGYLFACARNVLHDHLRGLYRGTGSMDTGVTSLFDLGASPSAQVEERQDRRLLLAALRRIPLDEQLAVELYYWEGLSGREVADVLG
nr:sigma-70 family RNA polymerase sigma factor [Deltaproteobacteria bacterium]